jgi:hypothetical protein
MLTTALAVPVGAVRRTRCSPAAAMRLPPQQTLRALFRVLTRIGSREWERMARRAWARWSTGGLDPMVK